MNISTFEDDLLELKDFSDRLESFIVTEVDYVEGSLVLALSSKYGSGKTTFLEMWKSSIESRGETADKPFVISLNAWESDYYGDPLFAIISALIKCLESEGKSVNSLVNAAKNFGWFTTAIGGQIVNKITGIDAVAAGELAEKKKGEREETIPDAFSSYLDRKTAMDSLKREIESFVAASKPRVLFLVDELDRCRPDYAITYLETIKHIFDIKGAVFLLAADRQQLQNSAKAEFGQDLDFEEYYRKFIHREIMLPKITETGYKRLATNYVPLYLERKGERHCFFKLDRGQVDNISDLIGALKLTPRQIQEVFRILGHIFSTSEANKGSLYWCLGVGSIAMAAFKVGNPELFNKLGAQQLDSDDALNYIEQTLKLDHTEWWYLLFLTGGGIYMPDGETKKDLIIRAGFVSEDGEMSIHGNLGQWSNGWGHSGGNHFAEIHERIEQILQWK